MALCRLWSRSGADGGAVKSPSSAGPSSGRNPNSGVGLHYRNMGRVTGPGRSRRTIRRVSRRDPRPTTQVPLSGSPSSPRWSRRPRRRIDLQRRPHCLRDRGLRLASDHEGLGKEFPCKQGLSFLASRPGRCFREYGPQLICGHRREVRADGWFPSISPSIVIQALLTMDRTLPSCLRRRSAYEQKHRL